jgi:hypothetical protein
MSDLWFARDFGVPLSRRGSMLFTSSPGEVWATIWQDLTYPDDIPLESDQLLGHYGALVHGAGQQLLGDGVQLPPELEHWATLPDRPASELGGWEPCLMLIDGATRLCLRRDFSGVRAFATTFPSRNLLVFVPSTVAVPELVTGPVDAPPFGYDQHGGGRPD